MFLYCELLSWNYFILMTMRSAESVLRTSSYTKFFARKEIFEKNSLLEINFLSTFKVRFVFEERFHEKLYQGSSLVIYCIYSNICTTPFKQITAIASGVNVFVIKSDKHQFSCSGQLFY